MDFIAMDQAVQELAGKIVVKRRDNESALRAQQGAIDKNEGTLTRLDQPRDHQRHTFDPFFQIVGIVRFA